MAGKTYPLSIILRTVDKFSGPLKNLDRSLGRVGKSMSKIGKSMSTNLTLPLIALGAASVKAMASFETGMSNVSTLIDTNTESLDAMGKEVLAIGRRTPVALEDLTSALYDTRSAGVSAADQFKVLEQSARLGVAGLGTTAEAVDLVTSSFNAFGLEGAEADKVYDNIFKTVKNGKTTIAELAQGFGGVAGVVADSGTELDEYLASVAALTTTGMPAAQAHTQLKAAISNLSKPTKELGKIFKELGAKDMNTLIAESGGLVPALARVREAVDNDSSAFKKLFKSTEASAAGLALTGQLNEKFTETLDNMRNGANAAGPAFKKQNETAQSQWKRTKNSLTSAGVSIGRVLAPALEKVAMKLEAVVGWFQSLDDDTKETIVQIAGVAAVVGPTLMVFGKLATALGMITKATKLLSLAISANPIGMLVAGLVAIKALTGDSWSTLFSDAIKFWRETFSEFFDWLGDAIRSAADEFRRFTIGGIGEKGGVLDQARDKMKADAKAKQLNGEATGVAASIRSARERVSDAASDAAFEALMARQPAAAQGAVTVKFENAPPGTRVKSSAAGMELATETGYQMGDF